MKKIYALYKGEKNICDGTIAEIAKFIGTSKDSVYCYKSPSHVKKAKENAYKLVFIGVENEKIK